MLKWKRASPLLENCMLGSSDGFVQAGSWLLFKSRLGRPIHLTDLAERNVWPSSNLRFHDFSESEGSLG
jgi:hypothetical protein